MIQPLRSRAASPGGLDLGGDLGQPPGHQQLVVGAEVGAPVDVEVLVGQALERAGGVQHDHHVVAVLGEAVGGEAAAGGDVDRPADPVQRDPVAGRQRLDAR